MTETLVLIASGALLAGTLIQALLAGITLTREQQELFSTVDDWRREVRWWRPVKRYKHRKLVRQVLDESHHEGPEYRRLEVTFTAWLLLFVGAFCAAVAAVSGPLGL